VDPDLEIDVEVEEEEDEVGNDENLEIDSTEDFGDWRA